MSSYVPMAGAPSQGAPLTDRVAAWRRRVTPVGLTAGSNSRERYRRALLTFVSSAAGKGVVVLTTALSVPLAIRYLGAERYGLWMAISSAVSMLAFTDFGLGNGLLNAVASASGKNEKAAVQTNVSTAFFLLAAIGAILALLFSIVYSYIPWAKLFHLTTPRAAVEAGPTCAVFFICFAAALPLGIVQKVQLGLQEGFRSNIWQTAGSILSLAGLLTAIWLRQGLPWLVAAVTGIPVVVLALNWAWEFGHSRPWLMPRWAQFNRYVARGLAARGGLFFFAQIGSAVAAQAPILTISWLFGPARVPEYAVAYRAISVLLLLNALLLGPFWPAYAEALAIRDAAWVRRTFWRTMQITLCISWIGAILFLCTYHRLIPLWVNAQVLPDILTAVSLAAFVICNGVRYATAMLLNGCNRVLGQALYFAPTVALGLLLAIYMGHRHGVGGVALAFAAAEGFLAVLQILEIRVLLRRLKEPSYEAAS